MRRFYDGVTVVSEAAGLAVALDGRPIRTPAGRPLALPTAALAEAIAAEWAGQGERLRRDRMPLTRLANGALDRVPGEREAVIAETLAYAATDLVCYRAEAPRALVQRQRAAWQPLLDWLAAHHGARLRVTRGVVPIAQDEHALARIAETVSAFDGWRLTGLHALAVATGSLVVALACVEGRIDGDAAWAASRIDEDYQITIWGEDAEAAARRAALRAEVVAAARFVALATRE